MNDGHQRTLAAGCSAQNSPFFNKITSTFMTQRVPGWAFEGVIWTYIPDALLFSQPSFSKRQRESEAGLAQSITLKWVGSKWPRSGLSWIKELGDWIRWIKFINGIIVLKSISSANWLHDVVHFLHAVPILWTFFPPPMRWPRTKTSSQPSAWVRRLGHKGAWWVHSLLRNKWNF